jgi:predicted ester cyclase
MCFIISCNDGTTTTTSESNNSSADKAIANNRSILKAIEAGDASKLDSFITVDAIDHSGPDGMTEVKGLENIKASLGTMKQDFTDFKFDIKKEAANGDYLFVLATMTGTTSASPGHGLPPNQKIEMTSVDVLKFNSDGKFTEHWAFNDPKDMMKMMGGNKPMDTNMDNKMAPKDSTKK